MRCNSCGLEEKRLLWTVKGFRVYRCDRCGLAFTDFTGADLSGVYEEDYYRKVYPDYETDREVHCMNYGRILDRIERMADKGRLLEIGSAFGFFLACAEQRGWETHGYELSTYASAIARRKYGVNVVNADFLNVPNGERYDCACIFDTIEHVADPSALLGKVAEALKPGGCLTITTGDVASPLARFFGKRWRMVQPPFHLYYYSPGSLAFLLRKHGFSIVSVTHEGKYQNLGSIAQFVFKIPKTLLPRLLVRMNLGDIMTVIAKLHSGDRPEAVPAGGQVAA